MKKAKPIPPKEFKRIYTQVPRICVEALIVGREGVVLTKRSIEPAKGLWHLPGGTVMFREKLADTVKRIALRETGLKVEIKKFLGVIEYPYFGQYQGHPISICFLAKIVGGTLQYDEDASDIRFFKKLPRQIIKKHGDFIKTHIKL